MAKAISPLDRWRALSPTRSVALVAAVLGAALFLPYLGVAGLWDPWETHYGEVARSMVARRDWVHPYWECAYFFSKPALSLWFMALGLSVTGGGSGEGALSTWTEWAMRLPFAVSSILALVLLSVAVARLAGKRAGMTTALILSTMPLYLLLSRQAVTDTPFVAMLTCALACALIGQLDPHTRHRAGWWYGFYVFAGLAALAKGLLGPGIPGVSLLLFFALSVAPTTLAGWRSHVSWLFSSPFRERVRNGSEPLPELWAQFQKMKLGSGLLVFAAVALPWYAVMFAFDGVDDESRTFAERFAFDHFGRMFDELHNTTGGGTFTYFIEQGAFAMFPWVALLPGALVLASRVRLRPVHPRNGLGVLCLSWFALTFLLLTLSTTKFHHYVFPLLPATAPLMALFLDDLWDEGLHRHVVSLLLGAVAFLVVGRDLAKSPRLLPELFVYNQRRPYPEALVGSPIETLGRITPSTWADEILGLALLVVAAWFGFGACVRTPGEPFWSARRLVTFVWSALAVAVFFDSRGLPPAFGVGVVAVLLGVFLATRMPGLRRWPGRVGASWVVTAFVGFGAAALVLVLGGTEVREWLENEPSWRKRLWSALEWSSETLDVRGALGGAITGTLAIAAIASVLNARRLLAVSFTVFALGFGGWLGWKHWVDLSPHWSQRDLFRLYEANRAPGEPIAAVRMNWRGETFYSRNRVKPLHEWDPKRAAQFEAAVRAYANLPGRAFALVEHGQFSQLERWVGPGQRVEALTDRISNNKFTLVTITDVDSQ